MPKKGHSEEQIVAVLRQVEAGARVEDVCRKAGISEATYYLWNWTYSRVGVSELRELRQLAALALHSARSCLTCQRNPARMRRSPSGHCRDICSYWAFLINGHTSTSPKLISFSSCPLTIRPSPMSRRRGAGGEAL